MRMKSLPILLIILLALGSCSGPTDRHGLSGSSSRSPLMPGLHLSSQLSGESGGGHQLLGYWELVFDFDAETAEAIPLRLTEGHFNVRKFLEQGPCTTCLSLLNFSKQPDNTFYIDVQFDHPFPGLDQFSGFDVRGIAIFNGNYIFPGSGLVISDRTLGDMELLNADGYTTLFNPVDFPPGSNLPILTYTKGVAATPLSAPATLNGYKCYFPDAPRRLFRSGETDVQTYHIARPAGTLLRVGYAVDASWEPPKTKPVIDPLTDFGPNANCLEAYTLSISIGSGLMPGCGFAPYQIDVYDHQGHDTIDRLAIEAPDLMNGLLVNNSGADMGDFTRFTGTIPNALKVGEGEFRVLIGAIDKFADPFLGPLIAYAITTARVELVPIEYDHHWRKHGKTLDNNNHNPYETQISTTLTEVWRHQFDGGVGSTFDSTPTIGDFAVYVVADVPYEQKIWALDLETGEPIWDNFIKFVPDPMIYRSTPTVGNCEVYVGGSSLFCFNSEDGEEIWTADFLDAEFIQGGPVVVDDIVVAWGSNNYLLAFDAWNGDYIWDYTNGETIGNPSTPAVDNGVVYAGDMLGNAFAVDLYTGEEIWKEQFAQGGPIMGNRILASPVLAGGLVWFGSFNCHLYGLNPADGSVDVEVPLNDQIPWASPAFDGNYLYLPLCYDPPYWQFFMGPFRVLAITTAGDIAWEFPGTDVEAFFSSPVVANGIVWVPSDAGVIYMLDPLTGNPVGPGQYVLDNPVTGGMSIQDGRLYTVDSGGIVYCLKTP